MKIGKNKIPKDLGLKVETQEEYLWNSVKQEALLLIKQSNNNLIIQEAILKLADEKIKEAQSK
jgi:hypothetical protein